MLTVNRTPVRVLLVNESDEIGELYKQLFAIYGRVVELARNGERAVAVAQTFRPHAVYISADLEDVAGAELATKLRALSVTRNAVLVALSGYRTYAIDAIARAAGIDWCLVKPVGLYRLFRPLAGIDGVVANEAVSAVLQQAQPTDESKAYAAFRSSVLNEQM